MFAGSNVPFSAFARRPASTHANALSRETELFIDQPIDQMITVELDDSLKALSGIKNGTYLWEGNRFQISADHRDRKYTFSLEIPRQRVNARDYAAFRAWCQQVERNESFSF